MDEQIQTAGESQPTSLPEFDLSVGSIIANGFTIGFKYFFQILLSFILWVLTFWIPYVNVGTTIGLYGLIVKMSKDESFDIFEIFRKEYRAIIPEFLILVALQGLALYFAFAFFIIPGIIVGIALGFSYFFLIDKKMGVLESLYASNKTTYGHKWDIFGAMFIIYLIGLVPTLIFWLLFRTTPDEFTEFSEFGPQFNILSFLGLPNALGVVLIIIVWLIISAVIYGAEAYIYRQLAKKI
ncbi:MAG: YciC family protein [Ignavibacteria bacterium]|nr:YciC family protein [Ignavibacteria bacterium]